MDDPKATKARARTLRRRMTLPEVLLWQCLRRRQVEDFQFRRQHPMGPFVLDFYCHRAKLAIEIDGYFHGVEGAPERDEARDAWFAARGVQTLRIPAATILGDTESAVDAILAVIRQI